MQSARRIDTRLKAHRSLEKAIADYQSGIASIDDVMQAYYVSPRVKRLIAHACFTSRLTPCFRDELTQELALLLTKKFVQTTEDTDKIYNVLHVSACHIARRKSEKNTEESLDLLLEQGKSVYPITAGHTDDRCYVMDEIGKSMDRKKAMDEFNRRLRKPQGMTMQLATSLRMSCIDTVPQLVQRRAKASIHREKLPNEPSEAGIELNDIRKELGYSVPEFAKLLNTSKGTLSSYLYGIVRNVPTAMLEEARTLRREAGSEFRAINLKFNELSMHAIIDGWVQSLGIQSDDKRRDTLLAEVLRVDRATVWRWRERNMRPEPRKLKEYDDLVSASLGKHATN